MPVGLRWHALAAADLRQDGIRFVLDLCGRFQRDRRLSWKRQTMTARRSKFKPYSKTVAILSLILETFAMEG